MKLHAPDPRATSWALCGHFGDCHVTTEPTLVNCGHCLRRLGIKAAPRWCTPAEAALIEAVRVWHDSYVIADGDTCGAAESVLCAAFDAYQADLEQRRHYTG